jgi:hypothetical protein
LQKPLRGYGIPRVDLIWDDFFSSLKCGQNDFWE